MEAPLSPPLKVPEHPKPRRPRAAPRRPGIPLGRIFGLDIRLDLSWLIIFALAASSLLAHFAQSFPQLSQAALWATALGTTIVFFASLLLHEISHSLLARRRGLEVQGITLFLFGGVSQIREEPKRPLDEFFIALVGPVTSAVLGLLFLSVSFLFPDGSLGAATTGWLGRINLILAAFNLLPGFPLDGGRILRAGVWALTGNLRKATRAASFMGAAVAIALAAWGMQRVFVGGRFVEGLWLGLIAWFLFSASQRSVTQMELRDTLRRLRVQQAMRSSCATVPLQERVDQFVEEFVFKRGGKCTFVVDGEQLRGLVTLDDVRRLSREDWVNATVGDIMIPLTSVKSVSPSDSLLVAYERMNDGSLNQLPVMENGEVRGVITRNDLFRLVATFLELTGSSDV